jgi:hypothetical protein
MRYESNVPNVRSETCCRCCIICCFVWILYCEILLYWMFVFAMNSSHLYSWTLLIPGHRRSPHRSTNDEKEKRMSNHITSKTAFSSIIVLSTQSINLLSIYHRGYRRCHRYNRMTCCGEGFLLNVFIIITTIRS